MNLEGVYGDGTRSATASLALDVLPAGPAKFTDLFGTNPTGHMLVIDRPTILDADVTVNGLHVESELIFPPDTSRTLTVNAHSVMVSGKLTMKPSSASVDHLIRFVNINEALFVGGDGGDHHTDPGLMAHDAGVLDLAGAAKVPWARLTGAVVKGATTLTLDRDPTGWRVGDEVVVTPTEAPTVTGFSDHHEVRTVTAISGRIVTVAALTYPHPTCTLPDGRVLTAEVLNLTRNVRVEGTSGGRTHLMLHGTAVQQIRNVALRWMGPRQLDGAGPYTKGVLGRYGVHFHLPGDTARGSLIENVVVRDAGNHAFVPHGAHGVTFRGCISHDTFDEAYWWDPGPTNVSHDLLWEGCAASRVRNDPAFRGYRLAGFTLGAGLRNVIRGCFATGVGGNLNAAGFNWVEGAEGVWGFSDCVSHNNAQDGFFTWQNTSLVHVITTSVCYRNGRAGIEHGAYNNPYVYQDMQLVENLQAGVMEHAMSLPPAVAGPITYRRVTISGSKVGVLGQVHTIAGPKVLFENCRILGATTSYLYDQPTATKQDFVDFVDCELSGVHVSMPHAPPGSLVREIVNGQVVNQVTV